jgi:hypothetical protein
MVDRASPQKDATLPAPEDTREGIEGGALPRTIAADEGHDLPFPHLQGNPSQGMDIPIVGVKVFNLQERLTLVHGVSLPDAARSRNQNRIANQEVGPHWFSFIIGYSTFDILRFAFQLPGKS